MVQPDSIGSPFSLAGISEVGSRVAGLDPEGLRAASAAVGRSIKAAGSLPNDLVVEALAIAREAIRRATGSWPSDAQVMQSSRMRPGRVVGLPGAEAHGPVVTMSAYLHCLAQAPVHVVVADETSATALATQVSGVMKLLGVTAASLSDAPDFAEDRAAYDADVIVGSSARFCYDYLTDCLAISPEELIQPSRRFAIVADADIVLIEEATLLRVIAGDYVADAGQYERMKELADGAVRGVHYRYRRGVRRLEFSAVGLDLIQQTLGVTDLEDFSLLRVAQQVDDAFVAKDWLRRGVDYEVRDGGVHPVPSLQRNIRYETGILQAIEAREDLFVSDEALPLARIRVSDYFRLYGTLTGFASLPTPELATELRQRYNIELLDIPEDTTPAEDSVRGGKPWSRLPGWPRRRAEDTDPSLRDKRSRDDRLTAIENQHFEQITALRLRFLETANPQDDIKRIRRRRPQRIRAPGRAAWARRNGSAGTSGAIGGACQAVE